MHTCVLLFDIFSSIKEKKGNNGAVTLEIFSTFYHNNYGNYNFIADTHCDRYIFYVNESM